MTATLSFQRCSGESDDMPESYRSEPPSLPELARRVARVEDRLDARTLTVDVYQAEKQAHVAEVQALKAQFSIELAALTSRIAALEGAVSGATKMILGSFLALLVQFIILGVSLFGRAKG